MNYKLLSRSTQKALLAVQNLIKNDVPVNNLENNFLTTLANQINQRFANFFLTLYKTTGEILPNYKQYFKERARRTRP